MSDPIITCRSEMARGVCYAQLDRAAYRPGATLTIPGVGRVPMDAYIDIRNAGDGMCSLAAEKCEQDPRGAHCTVAHALWDKPGDDQVTAPDPVAAAAILAAVIAAAIAAKLRGSKPIPT